MELKKPVRSLSPFTPHKRPNASIDTKSWKIGKYQNNSGIQNAVVRPDFSSVSSRSNNTSEIWPQHTFDHLIPKQEKKFTSNSESLHTWDPPARHSLINHQNRDYNFITHTVNTRPESTTTSRQKGFGEFLSIQKPSKRELFRAYQKSLEQDPTVFRKKVGEFSKHQENCVRFTGKGPFFKPY